VVGAWRRGRDREGRAKIGFLELRCRLVARGKEGHGSRKIIYFLI
jgi:hypothetical protein